MKCRMLLLVALFLAATPSSSDAIEWEFVRITDDATVIPGRGALPPLFFTRPGNPQVSNGEVAFTGFFSTLPVGIYIWRLGEIVKVADINTDTPGISGTFNRFGEVSFDHGDGAFVAQGDGINGVNEGIYKFRGGALLQVASTETDVPGQAAGTKFGTFGEPWFCDSDMTIFRASFIGGEGIYLQVGNDPVTLVADTDTPIPGGTGNFLFFQGESAFNSFLFGIPAVENGLVAFVGRGVDTEGVYLSDNGAALEIVADTSTAAPGGALFTGFDAARPINIVGTKLAFGADSTGGGDGVYLYDTGDGTVTALAEAGDTISGTSDLLTKVGPQGFGFNGSETSFLGSSTSAINSIYTTVGGALTEVARNLEFVPGEIVSGTYPKSLDGDVIGFNGGPVNWVAVPSHRWVGGSGDWDANENWRFLLAPRTIIPTILAPTEDTIVIGPTTSATIRSLELGGGGVVTLDLAPAVVINVEEDVTINASGVLSGTGFLDATNVQNDGQIEVDIGGTLTINAETTNSGLISTLQAQLELGGLLANETTGEIFIRDTWLRVTDGITNAGLIASSGISDVVAELTNQVGGTISLTETAVNVFHNDVLNEGTLDMAAAAEVSFLGNLNLGNTSTLDIVLSSPGDSSVRGPVLISGTLSAGGTLRLNSSGYAVVEDEEIILFTHSAVSGQFTDVIDASGQEWEVDHRETTTVLTPVPEGGCGCGVGHGGDDASFILFALVLMFFRRRHRSLQR